MLIKPLVQINGRLKQHNASTLLIVYKIALRYQCTVTHFLVLTSKPGDNAICLYM